MIIFILRNEQKSISDIKKIEFFFLDFISLILSSFWSLFVCLFVCWMVLHFSKLLLSLLLLSCCCCCCLLVIRIIDKKIICSKISCIFLIPLLDGDNILLDTLMSMVKLKNCQKNFGSSILWSSIYDDDDNNNWQFFFARLSDLIQKIKKYWLYVFDWFPLSTFSLNI